MILKNNKKYRNIKENKKINNKKIINKKIINNYIIFLLDIILIIY